MSANTSGHARARQGICGLCDNRTANGPWTDERIAEVTADTGTEPSEFEDWCDDCFVGQITQGDAREAVRLAGVVGLHYHDTKHEACTRLPRHIDVLALSPAIGTKDVRLLRDTYYADDAERTAKLLPPTLVVL